MIHRCSSFGLELIKGLDDVETDTIKIALYDGSASFSSATTVYTASNEISPSGYTAGGLALTLVSTYPKLENGQGAVRFENPTWTLSSSATIKWALMYNETSDNRAILAIDLGDARTVIGPYVLNFPLTLAPIIQIAHQVT